ncbi:J domain-containing protein [Desulfobulbus sp.]|uniref:J domain-containing protein n=1 Tax=Desulfobulbus sp. TaxID=895 RepID=UPI0027B90151|nr:DnaJ domain-containing protein [Desulfobulbus sp.]
MNMKEQQLLRACTVLFGAEVMVSRGFLDYLQLSGLKSAYRRRALETHPDGDRTASSACDAAKFFEVREAYARLLDFLRRRDGSGADLDQARQAPPLRPEASSTRTTPSESSQDSPFSIKINPIVLPPLASGPAATSIDRFHQGPLPNRPLLFGHFLYYSGLTTWRTITRILIWQKQSRPRCGELGNRFGMLNPDDIALILRNKTTHTPFGEVALALGLLSEEQLQRLLMQQQRLQKKFGVILLEKQLVDEQELRALLRLFRLHNQASALDNRPGFRSR